MLFQHVSRAIGYKEPEFKNMSRNSLKFFPYGAFVIEINAKQFFHVEKRNTLGGPQPNIGLWASLGVNPVLFLSPQSIYPYNTSGFFCSVVLLNDWVIISVECVCVCGRLSPSRSAIKKYLTPLLLEQIPNHATAQYYSFYLKKKKSKVNE